MESCKVLRRVGMWVVQVTGFGYEHDAAWSANMDLFRQFTDETTGVRRLGAAAVDLCHVALGVRSRLVQGLDTRRGILPVSIAAVEVSLCSIHATQSRHAVMAAPHHFCGILSNWHCVHGVHVLAM